MKAWQRRLLWFATGAIVVYSLIALDVVLRARQAYLEGEKASNPGESYAWYESAATQFTPPESRWSRLARSKMSQAKARWKADLHARGIPATDEMLQ